MSQLQRIPDTHTPSNLFALFDGVCGAGAEDATKIPDACEPPGDRIVITSAGVDAEIRFVELQKDGVSLAGGPVEEATSVRLTLAQPIGSVAAGASDVEIARGDDSFDLGADETTVESSDATTITLLFSKKYDVGVASREFFDDRVYPWDSNRFRAGDPNRNGVLGSQLGVRQIVPGDPQKSYVILRLIDRQYGDLMPRQCRKWDDQATLALGCWIEGLVRDADGVVVNADAPIRYDNCKFNPIGLGRCGTGSSVAEILGRSCAGSSCHIGEEEPQAGLDMSEGKWHGELVNVSSSQQAGRQPVVPGDPDASYLMCKLTPDCTSRSGAIMPSTSEALAETDLAVIRSWIQNGALPE